MSLMYNRSGQITTGGAAQTLSSRANRNGFSIQNFSDDDLFIGMGDVVPTTAPVTGSAGCCIRIPAGALYESPSHFDPPGTIRVFGMTTGQQFSAWEW